MGSDAIIGADVVPTLPPCLRPLTLTAEHVEEMEGSRLQESSKAKTVYMALRRLHNYSGHMVCKFEGSRWLLSKARMALSRLRLSNMPGGVLKASLIQFVSLDSEFCTKHLYMKLVVMRSSALN